MPTGSPGHGQAGDDGGASYALFNRSRISLPVLKNGKDFCVDRHIRASARIAPGARRAMPDRERPETAQFDPVAARQRGGDLAQHRVDDVLDVAAVEMRVLPGNVLNELRLDHSRLPSARRPSLRDTREASLVRCGKNAPLVAAERCQRANRPSRLSRSTAWTDASTRYASEARCRQVSEQNLASDRCGRYGSPHCAHRMARDDTGTEPRA